MHAPFKRGLLCCCLLVLCVGAAYTEFYAYAEAWEAMGEVEREKKQVVIHEFESYANHWRLSAYESIWEEIGSEGNSREKSCSTSKTGCRT